MLRRITDYLKGKAPLTSKRSPKWRAIRLLHLKKHPRCAACGGTKKIEVHHIVPFHKDPSLELTPWNLITLCEAKKKGINCHLLLGHLGNYKQSNPEVRKDAHCTNLKLTKDPRS